MKKTLAIVLTIVATLAFTSAVRAGDNSAVQTAQAAIEQAKQTLANAEATYKNVKTLAASGVAALTVPTNPITVVNITVANPNTNVVTVTNKVSIATNGISATINETILTILQGGKTVSTDLYNASKMAITKSVDFTMEQAPLVVREFLHWKLAEAIIYFLAWSVPAGILFAIYRAMKRKSLDPAIPTSDKYKTDQSDYGVLKWIFLTVSLVALTFNLTTNGMAVTKICVAPRVYMIEYVVSTIHNGVPPSQ